MSYYQVTGVIRATIGADGPDAAISMAVKATQAMVDAEGSQVYILRTDQSEFTADLVTYTTDELDELERRACRVNGPHDAGLHVDTCPDAI